MSLNPSPKTRRRPDAPPLALIYGLLALPLLMLAIFSYVPAASALMHAFTRWDIGAQSHWTGLENFRRLLGDPVFLKSLINLAKLGTFILIVNLTVPFAVAEMIFHLKHERWRYLCRVALVLPMMVPGVVVIMIWAYIYSDAGILTELLHDLGLEGWIYGWLSHPKTALWAIAFVGFPFAHGFNVLVYYAGLNNISNDVLEAAEVDGLGPIGRIVHIHLPLIAQQGKLLLILTVIGVVNGFETIYILTYDGGPGYETMVPGLYMYLNGFNYKNMGYACAIGLVLLVFLLCFTIAVSRLIRTEKYEPGD